MANKRMFSQVIIASDAFLDMPTSSRELYFQLGMYADDDGFVNPKRIMKMIGASDDDLKVLLAKRFLLAFENGVVVIKHWLIHNTLMKDRYKETTYLHEKGMLKVKDNKAYTEKDGIKCYQNVNKMITEDRLGKDRLDKNNISETSSLQVEVKFDWNSYLESWKSNPRKHIKLIAVLAIEKGLSFDNKEQADEFLKRWNKEAATIVKCNYTDDQIYKAIDAVKTKWPEDWGLTTVKKYLLNTK